MHQAGGLDFARVVTFNLDEYFPMAPDSIHSYRRYMWENLFAHVNVDPANVHIPDGSVARGRLAPGAVARALPRAPDRETRAHLQDVRYQISKILYPEKK